MADKRMIPIVTFEDPNFGKLSPVAMVMFIGMIVLADDEGRLRANPTYLTSRIFGYKGYTLEQSKKIVNEVIFTIKSVKRYVVENEEYIQLTKWNKYQILRKDRLKPSMYPSMSTKCQPNVNQMSAQVKLSKAKLSKERVVITPTFLNQLKEDNEFRLCKIDYELKKWQDWKLANGKSPENNQASFRNWLRKAIEFSKERNVKTEERYEGQNDPLEKILERREKYVSPFK